MIFKPDRSTNACNNLTMSRLFRHNFDRDLYRLLWPICTSDIGIHSIYTHYCIQNTKKYKVRYLDRLNPIMIARPTFRSISSDDCLHHSLLFFLWLAAITSLQGWLMRCFRELIKLALLFAIGDDLIITSASTMFRSEHHWALTTPSWSIYSKSHQSLS